MSDGTVYHRTSKSTTQGRFTAMMEPDENELMNSSIASVYLMEGSPTEMRSPYVAAAEPEDGGADDLSIRLVSPSGFRCFAELVVQTIY